MVEPPPPMGSSAGLTFPVNVLYLFLLFSTLFDIVNTVAINAFWSAPVGMGAKRRRLVAAWFFLVPVRALWFAPSRSVTPVLASSFWSLSGLRPSSPFAK